MYFKRLRELREDNDKTQTEIGKILMITYQQYQLYEKGIREIKLDLIIKLANYYNTSIDYILELTDEIKPYPRSKNAKKTATT